MNRREFLRLAGAAPLVLTIPGRSFGATLPFRPAAFDATRDSALIWLKGDGAKQVRVEYENDGSPAARSAVASLARDSDYTATIALSGLAAGKAWKYRVVDAESGQALSEQATFKTAPSSPQPFRFAFSADMEEKYQPFRLFDVIGGKEPDFFLHLGDTVYADHGVRKPFSPNVAHYRSKHTTNRKDPHGQRFMSNCVTYAIWDDHETEDGCDGSNPFMDRAFQAFKEYWPCKTVVPNALYRQFNWAGIDFFVLDTRRFRSQQNATDGPDKTMLGAEQKSWLKEGLKASNSPFKFIITSVPFQGGGVDTWGSYKTERTELTRFLQSEKIRGVIFLTGDYHLARDWSNPKAVFKEYMAGPIASFNHYERTPDARARYEKAGTFHYGDGYNFGLWNVDPAAGKAKLEFVKVDGQTIFQTELSA